MSVTTLREQARTPRPIPRGYDWRKEPWVNDANTRALSHYIAFHVFTGMAAGGDDKQDIRDEQVVMLLSPEVTEQVWKGPHAAEILDNRTVCAACMGIDKLITEWVKRLGSIDHNGPDQRSK